MDEATFSDCFGTSQFTHMQADALSTVLEQMNPTFSISAHEATLGARLAATPATFRTNLTWRIIAIGGFFATAAYLFNTIIS